MFMLLVNMNDECLTIGAYTIKINMIVCGIDGKVRNLLSDNDASTSCPMCRRSKSQLCESSYDEHIEAELDEDILLLGVSPLYQLSRVMETAINLGVRLKLGGKWLVYGARNLDRIEYDDCRKKIKEALKVLDSKIVIDRAQHGRVGNVGNVARAFFSHDNVVRVAELLGLPVKFMMNLAKMLFAINSPTMMDVEHYEHVARETWDMYKTSFPTYYMSPSLHMLLVHVPQLQRILDIPISFLTEECIEASHKLYRRALRRNVCYTNSRTVLRTLLRHMLIATDHQVALRYHLPRVEHRDIPEIFKEMFVLEDQDELQVEDDEWCSDSLRDEFRTRLQITIQSTILTFFYSPFTTVFSFTYQSLLIYILLLFLYT